MTPGDPFEDDHDGGAKAAFGNLPHERGSPSSETPHETGLRGLRRKGNGDECPTLRDDRRHLPRRKWADRGRRRACRSGGQENGRHESDGQRS